MRWLIRAVEVAALMFGTDVLWFAWGTYQRRRVTQVKALLAGLRKKKRRVRLVPARIPKRVKRG